MGRSSLSGDTRVVTVATDENGVPDFEKNLLKEGDKIILLGYGGGLNTGSILMEV